MDNCPLCYLPSREPVLYEDDSIYLVSTKENRGHKVRVMCCTKRHTIQPSFDEETKIYAVLINYMENLMLDQDWYIVSSQNATIPEHFHIIACDAPLEDELDPLFVSTPKVVFPIRRSNR